MARLFLALLGVLVFLLVPRTAHAGGLEYPDNGAQAMGRGAAFTAKADDGTALMYNVAGLARQRGWRLTVGANVAFHQATFQRSGVYPDSPSDPLTPWGGQKFPLVKNTGSPLPIPHLILSTDLGTDRLTVAMGIYAPSVLAGRVFPLGVEGKPSPARYDATRSGGLIAYPTLAAAYRVTSFLDLGFAANFVIASLEATSMSSADLAKALCPNQEYQPCDSRQTITTTGGTVAFSAGAMLRPDPALAIGVQLRTAHTLETEGNITAKAPSVQPATIPPGQAFLTQPFPWILRTGIRYVSMDGKREAWDAELDVTYEAWGSALADGTKVHVPKLSLFKDIRSTIKVGFQDTMSVRAGGAYNIPLGSGSVLSLRAGAFHDTAATRPENTRLLFDTLAKTGLTAGVGFKTGAVSFDLALANIFHETREVTNGAVRPINGSQGGKSVDSTGAPYAPVNNGVYTAATFVVALGMTVQLEELFGSRRAPSSFGADYELGPRVPERRPADETQEEPEAKKAPEAPSVASAQTPAQPEAPYWEAKTVIDAAPVEIGPDRPEPKKPDPKKAAKRKPRTSPKARKAVSQTVSHNR